MNRQIEVNLCELVTNNYAHFLLLRCLFHPRNNSYKRAVVDGTLVSAGGHLARDVAAMLQVE